MRKLFYTFLVALLSTGMFAQTHAVHQELGQAWGGGSSVDIDGDGDLDFYIAGSKNNPSEPFLDPEGNPIDFNEDGSPDTTERWQRLYMLNESGFEETPTNLRVVDRANLDWADIDGDGLVDLFATEHSFNAYNKPDEPWYHGGIYTNLGNGMFTKLDWPLYERTNAGAFADFNNDGHIDYVGISADSAGSFVYINQGDDTFEETNGDVFGEYKFGIPYLEVIDFNNDGLSDIFITSNCDNPATNDGARVICDIFINNDEEPGTFYRAFIGDNGVYQKGNGGVDFADFNGDGYLDFALYGEGGAGTPEPAEGDIWACITHVYLNQGDGTFTDKPQPAIINDIRPLISTGNGTGAFDWDNDGIHDLIITGWAPAPGPNTQAAYLYKGDGAGNFTEVGRVPGGSETVLLFNDWNGDGVMDFLCSGHCWDEMWYTSEEVGRTASVYFNTNTSSPNVRPSAPGNLSSVVEDGKVTLSWDAAMDDKSASAALTYEYYLKDGNGDFVVAPASHVGGDLDGVRMVVKNGNLFLNRTYTLYDLPSGGYTWSVQAIDASYEGSAFAAEASFQIVGVSVEPNSLESRLKVYAVNDMVVVKLEAENQGTVSIYNLTGQLMRSDVFNGEFRTNMPAGTYVVKVDCKGDVLAKMVMVTR
ncbi:MAG: T9SS type A sorting domain-containing protein [Bacteroidales bacterium]